VTQLVPGLVTFLGIHSISIFAPGWRKLPVHGCSVARRDE